VDVSQLYIRKSTGRQTQSSTKDPATPYTCHHTIFSNIWHPGFGGTVYTINLERRIGNSNAEISRENFPCSILARILVTSLGCPQVVRVRLVEYRERHDTQPNGQHYTAADRRPTNQVSAWQAERGSRPTRRHPREETASAVEFKFKRRPIRYLGFVAFLSRHFGACLTQQRLEFNHSRLQRTLLHIQHTILCRPSYL